MKITKIKIENFKSIKEIEFDIKKYGNSYTTMLVGINESGKSNILEAMSYFKTPVEEFDYNVFHTQQDKGNNPVNFSFSLEFEDNQIYINELRKIIQGGNLLHFEINNIVKKVYLKNDEVSFLDDFDFEFELLDDLFIREIRDGEILTYENDVPEIPIRFILSTENDAENSYQELNRNSFEHFFKENIVNIIKKHEPEVLLWKPSDEYLISTTDLRSFENDIDLNVPLKKIFYIAGFKDAETIHSEIQKISNVSTRRSLANKLGKEATKYVKNIWKHNVNIEIEINDNSQCSVFIHDCDRNDESDSYFFEMMVRSAGFKHFMSLILSLSIETNILKRKNRLILIDEPETHLHPSGIRDLKKELLKIGKNNYLFIATHSPFLIDRKDKERNIIIKKNNLSLTEKINIDKNTNIIDEEVLREAFGIEVYKDLLNPHSILVEGASDKQILQKAFTIKNDMADYGITNGHGSNIDTLASKLNDTDISILVILDDDNKGRKYKKKIIKIGGSYSINNVFTIRDLVGDIINGGTIEDVLGIDYLGAKILTTHGEIFTDERCDDFILNDTQPSMKQIRIYLQQQGKAQKVIDKFLKNLKNKISNDFNPTQSSFTTNFPKLDSLVNAIRSKLDHPN